MGQIIIPSDRIVNGPWLLDEKSLEDLHNTLIEIENKLSEAYTILLDKKAEDYLNEYKERDKKFDIEQAKQKVKETYTFAKSDKFVLIFTKQGKKIKDENLLSILKGGQINEFNPIELKIQIEKGPCEFTLEVTGKFEGELETRIKVPEDNIFSDINYEINKWIDQHKPNVVMQKWSSWFPLTAYFILIFLLFFTPSLLKDRAALYNNQLAQEGNQLLKDGLTAQEMTKAIEIILKKETSFVPETFSPEIAINKTVRNFWIVSSLALILLMIKPKTIIGLGKNKWKVEFYRKWVYFVLVIIPLSIIFPYIVNKLS